MQNLEHEASAIIFNDGLIIWRAIFDIEPPFVVVKSVNDENVSYYHADTIDSIINVSERKPARAERTKHDRL